MITDDDMIRSPTDICFNGPVSRISSHLKSKQGILRRFSAEPGMCNITVLLPFFVSEDPGDTAFERTRKNRQTCCQRSTGRFRCCSGGLIFRGGRLFLRGCGLTLCGRCRVIRRGLLLLRRSSPAFRGRSRCFRLIFRRQFRRFCRCRKQN